MDKDIYMSISMQTTFESNRPEGSVFKGMYNPETLFRFSKYINKYINL
jgi:hypothetical protein